LAVLQAVIELSEELIERVPVGLSVAVTVLSSTPVVQAGGFAVRGSGERPDPAESVEFTATRRANGPCIRVNETAQSVV